MSLPIPAALNSDPADKAIVALLRDTLVSPCELAARWGCTQHDLAYQRRRGVSIPYIRLDLGAKGKGTLFYRESEIAAAEFRGTRCAITCAEVEKAIAACPDIAPEDMLRLLIHVRRELGAGD